MSYEDPTEGRQPTEEEIRAMEEQMRRIQVRDVLLNTVLTLLELAGRRLGVAPETRDQRDLEQARQAIEGLRALVPLVGGEEERALKQHLSQLQMLYAREARGDDTAPSGEGAAEAGPPGPATGPQGPTAPSGPETEQASSDRSAQEEAERAKARSRIWTPRGS